MEHRRPSRENVKLCAIKWLREDDVLTLRPGPPLIVLSCYRVYYCDLHRSLLRLEHLKMFRAV